MKNENLADDGKDVFERTLRELEGFDYPEGADTIRSVRATIYRHTKTCHRGKEQDELYDCTATYQVKPDGSHFRIIDINGHFRGKKIEYIDGFGVHQVVGMQSRGSRFPIIADTKDKEMGWSVLTGHTGKR